MGDDIQDLIGQWGRFHLLVFGLMFLCRIALAWHLLGIIFLAPKVNFHCTYRRNEDGEEVRIVDKFNSSCPCPNSLFDNSVFDSTIVTYWRLICENHWKSTLAQFVFMFGLLVGSLVCGIVADMYGRKITMFYSVVMLSSSGVMVGITPLYWLFIVIRWVQGAAAGGVMVVSYVLLMEFVGPDHRETVTTAIHFPLNLGHLLLVVFGYTFRSYQVYQVALSLPMVLFAFFYCYLPESLRWMITKKKKYEAIKLAGQITEMNKLPMENIEPKITRAIDDHVEIEHSSLAVVFKNRILRRHVLLLSVGYFNAGLGYYGVSQYIGLMSGNIFVNVSVSASANCIGTLSTFLFMRLVGRRTSLIVVNCLSAIMILLLAFIPAHMTYATVPVACIGNSLFFISYFIVFLYAVELFPTSVRNGTVGYLSMVSRIGSMIAPFVNDLGLWVTPVIYTISPVLSAIACKYLPETSGTDLPQFIENTTE